MKILALETSGPHGSVCLSEDEDILSQSTWEKKNSHGEVLIQEVSTCLSKIDLSIHDVDLFAVGRGPGSFTGIRIAIATAKAFGYSCNRKIFAPNSMSVLAHAVPKSGRTLYVVQNAFSGLAFLGRFNFETSWVQDGEILLKPVEGIADEMASDGLLVGDATVIPEDIKCKLNANIEDLTETYRYPLASTLAHMAFSRSNDSQVFEWTALSPLYIRSSAAEEKLRAGLLKPV